MSVAKITTSLVLPFLLVLTTCSATETAGGGKSLKPTRYPYDNIPTRPRFSPDGIMIAYMKVTGEGNNYDLTVMTSLGKARTTIAPAGSYLAGPAWSPDSQQLYFASAEGISLVPAAGGTPSVVLKDFATTDPDVSPDGKSLVYAVNGDDLKLVDLANPTVIKDLGTTGTSPRFSPDGKTIAFENKENIHLMDVASGTVTQVAECGTYLASVDWFPDGKRLAVTTDAGIKIVTLGETPTIKLLYEQFGARSIDVLADGKAILYMINQAKYIYMLRDFESML